MILSLLCVTQMRAEPGHPRERSVVHTLHASLPAVKDQGSCDLPAELSDLVTKLAE